MEKGMKWFWIGVFWVVMALLVWFFGVTLMAGQDIEMPGTFGRNVTVQGYVRNGSVDTVWFPGESTVYSYTFGIQTSDSIDITEVIVRRASETDVLSDPVLGDTLAVLAGAVTDTAAVTYKQEDIPGLPASDRYAVIVTYAASGNAVRATRDSVVVYHLNKFYSTVVVDTGSGGYWGAITGTLADQTDLAAALSAKQAKADTATSDATKTWVLAQGYSSGTGDSSWGDISVDDSAYVGGTLEVGADVNVLTGNVSVQNEDYSSSWNGSVEVPTKNAVYDAVDGFVTGSGFVLGSAFDDSLARQGNGVVNVKTLVTGGSGTAADPWTGWNPSAFRSAATYYFPRGVYSTSTTMYVDSLGTRLVGEMGDPSIGNLQNGTLIKYTGTDTAIYVGRPSYYLRDVAIEGIALSCDTTTANRAKIGIFAEYVGRLTIKSVVVDVTFTYALISLDNCVLSLLENISVSDGSSGANAKYGILLGDAQATTTTTILNCSIAYTDSAGIYLDDADANSIYGGAMESNNLWGVLIGASASTNTFTAFDIENQATNRGMLVYGTGNTFNSCAFQDRVEVRSSDNMFNGCTSDTVQIASTALGVRLQDHRIVGSNALVIDSSDYTYIENVGNSSSGEPFPFVGTADRRQFVKWKSDDTPTMLALRRNVLGSLATPGGDINLEFSHGYGIRDTSWGNMARIKFQNEGNNSYGSWLKFQTHNRTWTDAATAMNDSALTISPTGVVGINTFKNGDSTLTVTGGTHITRGLKVDGSITANNLPLDSSAVGEYMYPASSTVIKGFRPVFNVKLPPYNAVGDSTANDSTAFVTAIAAAASAGGGKIYVPPGNYYVGTLRITSSNIEIFGDGAASQLVAKTNCDSGIIYVRGPADTTYVNNVSNIYIHDLAFYSTAGTFSEHVHHIRVEGGSDINIERCNFRRYRGDGIFVGQDIDNRHNRNITIRDCNFDGMTYLQRQAISITDGDNVLIENNYITRSGKTDMPGGIDIEPNWTRDRIKNITIRGNRFYDVRGNIAVITVQLEDQDAAWHKRQGFLIEGNYIDSCYGSTLYGIKVHGETAVDDSTAPHGVVIRNNVVRRVYGPFNLQGINGADVYSNTFDSTSNHGRIAYADESALDSVRNVRIRDNTFNRCGYTGEVVLYLGHISNVVFDGNTFQHCGRNTGGSGILGVVLANSIVSGLNVSNNTVVDKNGWTTTAFSLGSGVVQRDVTFTNNKFGTLAIGFTPINAGTGTFTTTATRLAIYLPGVTTANLYTANPAGVDEAPDASDILKCYAKTDSLIINRLADGTSGLVVNFNRIR